MFAKFTITLSTIACAAAGNGGWDDLEPGGGPPGGKRTWFYGGKEGVHPDKWVDLKGFQLCTKGPERSQSPINIETCGVIDLNVEGQRNFGDAADFEPASGLSIKNNGHALQVDGIKPQYFGDIELPSGKYEPVQFHFHMPSEHQIDGVNLDGEMHIVCNRKGEIKKEYKTMFDVEQGNLVLAVLLKKGANRSPFLDHLGWGSGLPKNVGDSVPINTAIDLKKELEGPLNGPYYHYDGSLTTPPCTESVRWFVLASYLEVSQEQIDAFHGLFARGNNRPIQALNGRKVVQGAFIIPEGVEAPSCFNPMMPVIGVAVVVLLIGAYMFYRSKNQAKSNQQDKEKGSSAVDPRVGPYGNDTYGAVDVC